MKVYMYYIPENFTTRRIWDKSEASNTLILYGFTSDKKVAKLFESIRDMENFEKRVRKMSPEEYSDFAKGHRDEVIESTSLTTHRGNNRYINGVEDMGKIFYDYKIAITYFEKMSVEDVLSDPPKILGQYFGAELVDPHIFSERVRNCLTLLSYDMLYYYSDADRNSIEIPDNMLNQMELHQISSIDELEVFLVCFGHTLDSKTICGSEEERAE